MTSFLPRDVQAALQAALTSRAQRKSRLRVVVDGRDHPVLRLWSNGFALSCDAPHLRGLVELYEGGRLLKRCLIVAAAKEGDEMRYDFKRLSEHVGEQPLDYVRAQEAPAGLLPRPDMG